MHVNPIPAPIRENASWWIVRITIVRVDHSGKASGVPRVRNIIMLIFQVFQRKIGGRHHQTSFITSSLMTSSSFVTSSLFRTSSSFVTSSLFRTSSSFVTSSSFLTSSSFVTLSSFVTSSSFVTLCLFMTSSFVVNLAWFFHHVYYFALVKNIPCCQHFAHLKILFEIPENSF